MNWRRRIEEAFSEPHRRYHTLVHLDHMFREAARSRPLEPAFEWAIWFHDVVYDPRSANNQEDSARVAVEVPTEMGESPAVIKRTAKLIRATRHGHLSAAGLNDDARLLNSAPAARRSRGASSSRPSSSLIPLSPPAKLPPASIEREVRVLESPPAR